MVQVGAIGWLVEPRASKNVGWNVSPAAPYIIFWTRVTIPCSRGLHFERLDGSGLCGKDHFWQIWQCTPHIPAGSLALVSTPTTVTLIGAPWLVPRVVFLPELLSPRPVLVRVQRLSDIRRKASVAERYKAQAAFDFGKRNEKEKQGYGKLFHERIVSSWYSVYYT